jgi:hypothetical protein
LVGVGVGVAVGVGLGVKVGVGEGVIVGVFVRRRLRAARRTGWVALGSRWADTTLLRMAEKLPHTVIEKTTRMLIRENQTA